MGHFLPNHFVQDLRLLVHTLLDVGTIWACLAWKVQEQSLSSAVSPSARQEGIFVAPTVSLNPEHPHELAKAALESCFFWFFFFPVGGESFQE